MSVKSISGKSRTDWKRIKSMSGADIDLSEAPELNDSFFSRAIRWPGHKKLVSLRLDPDVLEFFRRQGKGYQTSMNAVLRAYMESRKGGTRKAR
ncbi:MAG: BrnA antitoxin family protein [Nitrospinae bacterium]|nr:BrnA antitoxin family protein [Nitrospinota bacterium]